jgi:hypothetical protein
MPLNSTIKMFKVAGLYVFSEIKWIFHRMKGRRSVQNIGRKYMFKYLEYK